MGAELPPSAQFADAAHLGDLRCVAAAIADTAQGVAAVAADERAAPGAAE